MLVFMTKKTFSPPEMKTGDGSRLSVQWLSGTNFKTKSDNCPWTILMARGGTDRQADEVNTCESGTSLAFYKTFFKWFSIVRNRISVNPTVPGRAGRH
jgi:hypothetical protein